MSLQQMTVFRLAGTRNRIYKIQSLRVSKWKTEFYQWDKISFISSLLCPPTAACISMQEARRWFKSYYPKLFKVRITALPCLRWGHKNKCKVTGTINAWGEEEMQQYISSIRFSWSSLALSSYKCFCHFTSLNRFKESFLKKWRFKALVPFSSVWTFIFTESHFRRGQDKQYIIQSLVLIYR